MCGVAGILAREEGPPPDERTLQRMLASLTHRGPDDEGRFTDSRIAFGARRLSIIDVDGGHQPIGNEDGSVQVVLNGEIYNYRELTAELEQSGHRFRSRCDTEVVVHLYEERGDAFLEALNGMFALALWDARRRRLLLARDRLGIKPLYYHAGDRGLVFGSELKALLASGLVRPELDLAAVRDYVQLLYVPAPRSVFVGARKLMPGQYLVAENGVVELRTYWRPPPRPGPLEPLEGQTRRFLELFRDAVALQMRSDVPYGAFLSGGVDSSAVVAAMSERAAPVKTFSIGFAGSAYYNELPYARAVARRFGTEHEEFVVEPAVFDLVGRMVEFYDEPFADAAFLPTFVLACLSRRKVKVVLTGDGGDELFAGYDRYRSEVLAEWARRIPRLIARGVLDPLLSLYPGPADWRLSDWVRLSKKKLRLLELPPDERYVRHFLGFGPEELDRLAGDRLREADAGEPARSYRAVMAEASGADFLGQRMYLDVRTWLPDQMLTKVDRATMAHGLEARVPFLDHRIVELAMGLPQEARFVLWRLKRFLKAAFRDLLPREVLHRRKHGFEVPVDEWLRGPLRPLARDLLGPDRLRTHGLFQPAAVEEMLLEHEQRRRNRSRELFALLVFQLWHERWLGRNPPASAPA